MGIDVHIGSQLTELAPFEAAARPIAGLAEESLATYETVGAALQALIDGGDTWEIDLSDYDDGGLQIGNVVTVADGETVFTYDITWPGVPGECTTYNNIATISGVPTNLSRRSRRCVVMPTGQVSR